MKNFDLVFNICHKKKWDCVDSIGERSWWPKQVTTKGISSREGGEDGVGSRAREGISQVTIMTAKEKIAMAAKRKTLNSLITKVTFR